MKLYWEGYEIGTKRSSSGRTITEADIVLHAGQTGDFYPHHMDAEWCKTQVFGQRVAHGTLILSVAVGMLAGRSQLRTQKFLLNEITARRPKISGSWTNR